MAELIREKMECKFNSTVISYYQEHEKFYPKKIIFLDKKTINSKFCNIT
jgi:hypothetical protein